MNTQTKGRCIKCGSYAFNLYKEGVDQGGLCDVHYWQDRAHKAEAQPEQEPVAWMVYTQEGQSVYVTDNPTDIQEGQRALPLYTSPPQRPWVGLPEEEIIKTFNAICNGKPFDVERILELHKTSEAKLRELNT